MVVPSVAAARTDVGTDGARTDVGTDAGGAALDAGAAHPCGGSGPHPRARQLPRRCAQRPPSARPTAATRAEVAAATDPGGKVGLLAVLDGDRHGGSEGSAGHPTRALPPAEMDLPEGGAAGAAEAEA